MISAEPVITVGILERKQEVRGIFHGIFELTGSVRFHGPFTVYVKNGKLIIVDSGGVEMICGASLHCHALQGAIFTLCDVTIGIHFHWERKEDQIFEGNIVFHADANGTVSVINEIGVENYLKSVISSEMSAEARKEFLKAQAITSRSWLVAMLERKKKSVNIHTPVRQSKEKKGEILRWYGREDHQDFDVCADDHCQRYQGITKIITKSVNEAISGTRGQFLVYKNEICDARFSKACGGRSELFEHTWENTAVPYLQSVSDSTDEYPPVLSEDDAERWMTSSPSAYCNTTDGAILRHVLPSFDQTTTDFFRWTVKYSREQLENILIQKSGIQFGTLMDIDPVKRGPSGRLYQLKIVGSERTIIVGKELEIRRWLSPSHLYSSAFIVKIERSTQGVPMQFTFTGAGWGHGVGLCQIGAAMMALKGCAAEEIVAHYFRDTELKKLY
jgi:stage II sporulation protein D